MKDETGKVYGKLTVLRKSEKYPKGHTQWFCKCECGNTCNVQGRFLREGSTKSCGCIAKESARELASKLAINRQSKGEEAIKDMTTRMVETKKVKHYVDGVDTTALTMKLRSDNKSGVKGVVWDKSRSKWKAEIKFGGKVIYLGRFDTLEEAKQSRLEAEEKYHRPLLDKKQL
jgi:AP2 domain